MSACGFYRHLTSDCPRSLSEAKLTWLSYRKMSANDPKRTFVHLGILPFKRATLNFGYDFADCPKTQVWPIGSKRREPRRCTRVSLRRCTRVSLNGLYDALHKRRGVHAPITRSHSWSLSDDRIRLRVRRVDKRFFRTGCSDQGRAPADGQLGRCQRKLARVVLTRAQHLE